MALNYLEIKEIASSIDEKIKGNHIAGVTLVNSNDIVISFSFYRKEKMMISLNHNYPFVGMVDKEIAFPTVLNKLCEELRKNIKDTIVMSVNALNNDRILELTLQKTDEYYNKHIYYLVVELIPHHPNLLILDDNRKIIFANHYSSLTDKRIILKSMSYELPENNKNNRDLSVNLADFEQFVVSYLDNSISLRLKEKYSKLIDTIKRKIKTASRKETVLNKEIEDASKVMVYQEYGQMILTLKDDEEELTSYIKENDIPYDINKSAIENANLLFKKYKKSKETIRVDKEQLEINRSLLDKLSHDLCSLKY